MGIKKVIFICSQLICAGSFAYDNELCHIAMKNMGFEAGFYFISGVSTSSGQCALVDLLKVNVDRLYAKQFVQSNDLQLQKDISKGDGEYLTLLSAMLDCDKEDMAAFKLQAKFLFTDLLDQDRHLIFSNVNALAKRLCK